MIGSCSPWLTDDELKLKPVRTVVIGCSRLLGLVCTLVTMLAVCDETNAASQTQEAIRNTSEKVVKIFGAGGLKGLYSYGSGFLFSSEGHIATVWSTALDSPQITVILHDGRRYYAKLLGAETKLDMAILKIEATGLPHFDLEGLSSAGPGTRILGFSNMFKVATGNEQVSVLHGTIAARAPLVARRGVFDAPFNGMVYVIDSTTNNPGAGGGVITSLDGRLLGMIGKELRNTKTNIWMNYAIPIEDLAPALKEAVLGGNAIRPMTTGEDEAEGAALLPKFVPEDLGIVLLPDVVAKTPPYVELVLPDSPAMAAGIEPGDLILFIGSELVPSCRALKEQLPKLESGTLVPVVVRRRDALVSVQIEVPAARNR